MLQRVQPEVTELGNRLTGRPNSEHATLVLRGLVMIEKVVIQPPVSARHQPSVGGAANTPKRCGGVGEFESLGIACDDLSQLHNLLISSTGNQGGYLGVVASHDHADSP